MGWLCSPKYVRWWSLWPTRRVRFRSFARWWPSYTPTGSHYTCGRRCQRFQCFEPASISRTLITFLPRALSRMACCCSWQILIADMCSRSYLSVNLRLSEYATKWESLLNYYESRTYQKRLRWNCSLNRHSSTSFGRVSPPGRSVIIWVSRRLLGTLHPGWAFAQVCLKLRIASKWHSVWSSFGS